MKPATLSAVFSAAALSALLLFTNSASAQLIAYDDAGNYVVTANWTNGANLGFGFTPWAIVTNGPDFHGTYINSANNPPFVIDSLTNVLGTNYTDVWGVFANGPTDVNRTTAYRGFTNSLGTNTFKLQWGSRGAGSTATTNSGTVHGWCGLALRNGNSPSGPYDINSPDGTAQLFIFFLDGKTPSTIYYLDGSGDPVSVPNTSFSDLGRGNITNAIEAEITPGPDGSTYHMVLKDCVQNRIIFTTNSVFLGNGSIDSVAMFAYETSGDQVYNRMQIAAPTNIPPTLANVLPANGSLYLVAGSTAISFEVDSFNSTVVSNAVKLYINGVQQPGANLTFNTADPTAQLLVTNTATFTPDSLYTFAIVAADANGNVVSNNYNFNTFLTSDIYIDAYDYNYNQGQFINTNTPINAYAGLLGTNGVDYLISDLTGTNNTAGYRPGDLVQTLTNATDVTGEPIDHANVRLNGHTVYNIGFTDTGNWENYTRVYSATNYNFYARVSSTTGGQFELERLTNAVATTTNQPLIALGRFNFPSTGGSKVFTGQLTPLADFFGNPVVMPLSGTNTLRETSLATRIYNLEYILAVAAPNATTLRPYIATGSPVPNAANVLLTSPITFAVANRQTLVTNIQLFVNNTNRVLTLVTNPAGFVATFTPSVNWPVNFTNVVMAIVADNTGVTVTNTWNFITGTSGGVIGSGQWSGAGGSNDMFWADGINWTGGTPGPGFNASFASPAATTTLTTNNIVATNVTIQGLFYNTNNSGYHTTWIQDGVTLTVTNPTTGGATAIVQVGGTTGGDNNFNTPVTNTITGNGGTLLVSGNLLGSGQINNLNFQIRQASSPAGIPNLVTLDMSGLGTLSATVGKFYLAQGGANTFGQSNVSACVYLAKTNIITCVRPNAGQFEVGDSSGGTFTLAGSTLNLGKTNSLYADTVRFGKQKATNNLVRFNPVFTNGFSPAVYMRGGTNGPTSRVFNLTIGDADTETTVPNFVQANVDLSGGRVDAMVGNLIMARGETSASDTGFAQGTLTLTAGTLDVTNVQIAVQRAVSTATETGALNLNGTATLISSNIVLAQTFAGGNASLVNGSLNVTNGTVRGNVFGGGGVSTVNLNGGTLVVSNLAGTAASRLSALNLANASLHLKVDGNAPAANVNVTNVSATGTTTITIDSVANVTGPTNIHLISYTGSDPGLGGFASPVLPSGFTGNLVDNSGSVDLSINLAPSVPPTIHSIVISGGQIIISGTNNVGGAGTYHVLASTNVALPLASWTVLTNGNFDASGNFSSTNAVGAGDQQFYILKLP